MKIDNMILPAHIAFIMDGNGRWANERGLPRSKGHLAGINHIKEVVGICTQIGIQFITAYVWSTENWARPDKEVSNLMNSIVKYGPDMARELHAKGVRILHCGSRDGLDKSVLEVIDFATNLTSNDGPSILNLAFNYGSRRELIDAIKQIAKQGIPPDNIDEQTIQSNLYSPTVPDVDLLIRPGGEKRLSNFLLWQCANSVFHFTNTYWPSLSENDIREAVEVYSVKAHRVI
jgi:undecaprenyl diphosphate synthase